MRMTNKIMQNNSLYNINQTKIAEDKYTTQMTSQSKIDRPSDDPVVAIRALRLRTNVAEVTQYYEKNAPDADQWLNVTAGSLSTVTTLLTDMYKQAEKASNKDYKASDLQIILDQMKAYTQEFYATGNQDYAGRYIFTGYRTDTPLSFTETHTQPFEITENIGKGGIDEVDYTEFSLLKNNTALEAEDAPEQAITNAKLGRIRLSYENLTKDQAPTIKYTDKDGTEIPVTLNASLTKAEAYAAAAADGGKNAYFIAETGEIILSGALREDMELTLEEGGNVEFTYQKEAWKENDLNPLHYFKCIDLDKNITYNADGDVNTVINYDVGYNQKIQVNTNASEVFVHDLYRDIDDINRAISELVDIEKIQAELEEKQKEFVEGSDEYKKAQDQIDAAKKAFTYIRENVQKMMTHQMTKYQRYLDATDLAITQNGTRSSRLEMIGARLMDQKSTYKELQEENEGIDMTEVAVQLASAKLTYDAALQATSKILQNNLMNYI